MQGNEKEVYEESEDFQIDSTDIIKQLRKFGNGFKELDDYLEEYEED